MSMRFHCDDALIVVDVQRDFCPGGALEIAGGGDTVPIINWLMAEAAASGACIVASRDWHPKDHASFNPRGGVWPEHCIQESDGAKFHEGLRLPPDALVISKGADLHKDQYSAFDATGLTDELRRRGIRRVIICGLALDVCVRASALDAARAGFETRVMRQATRPVSNQDGERAILEMTRACAATIMMAGSSS